MNFDFYDGRITVDYLEGNSVFIELDEVMKYPDRVDYIPLNRCYIKFSIDNTISVRFVKDKKRYTYININEAFNAILDFIYRYWKFTYRYSYVVGYTDALDEIQIIMSKCWDSIKEKRESNATKTMLP